LSEGAKGTKRKEEAQMKKDYAIETTNRYCAADITEMFECKNYKPGIPPKWCRHLIRYSQECKALRKDAK